jgi:hypothetical protein
MNQSENLKQREESLEAKIASGERAYRASIEAAEGDYLEYPDAD